MAGLGKADRKAAEARQAEAKKNDADARKRLNALTKSVLRGGKKGEIMSTCWVYIRSEPGLWTVGFYAPDGTWHTDSDHASRDEAAARAHYLNGGVER